MYGLLADFLVGVHVGYVGYILVGQFFIWLGWALGWSCIRNPWFRWTHFGAMAIVAVETILSIECPLTAWERQLRLADGQAITGESFIGRMLHSLIFFELSESTFAILYYIATVCIVLTLVLCRPRSFRKK
jgi:hypothetical protein